MGLNKRKYYVNMQDFMAHDYAHRGLHDIKQGIPENTLAAFARAAELGFGAELDVHLTADGRLIVFHDDDLKRLCGVDKRTASVRSEEFAAYGILGTEHRAPFLEDVLALFVGKTPLVVEIKTDGGNAAAVTEAACRVLERYDVKYCIESFDPRVLLWLKQNRPQICRGQLSQDFLHRENSLSKPLQVALTNLLANKLTKPDFVAYKFEDRECAAVRRCRSEGIREFSWTVCSQADMDAAKRAGCAVIFEGFIPGGTVATAEAEKGEAKLRYRSVQKPGKFVDFERFVQWELPDGTIREPQPKEKELPYPLPFTAGGRCYTSWKQLAATKEDATGHICRDVYGRAVFAEWERFPCFDSSDYLHEHRCYRHFCLRSGDRLTYIYYADEEKKIRVTEDARLLPKRCFEAMERQNWQG